PLFGTGAGASAANKMAGNRHSTANAAPSGSFILIVVSSKRVVADLAGADAHGVIEWGYEDLAVADLVGARGFDDRVDDDIDPRIRHCGFELDLRHEVDDIFGAAVELGVAFLASVALDLGDRDAGDAGLRQRVANVVQLERPDDRG